MKKIISFVVVMMLCLIISVPTFAAHTVDPIQSYNSDITPFAEETEWIYRFYNGETQKRLWSITYERWLTDWMPLTAVV